MPAVKVQEQELPQLHSGFTLFPSTFQGEYQVETAGETGQLQHTDT
jgi:hypothetical protein